MSVKFLCPVCKNELFENERSFKCVNNHNFDRARQGYVNLLMSNKQSNHGDDKLMVNARSLFLDKGYYATLRERVASVLGEGNTVLDAGCGEGYYTASFAEKNTVFGIDVSKEALKVASRRCKNSLFAVASVFELPFAADSFDALINIFAPDSPSEYLRVLKKGGRLITVTPAEEHLMELKSAVYDNPYKNGFVDPQRAGFVIRSSNDVKYSISLESNQDIVSLFKMTPYYYNTSPADRQKLDVITAMTTRVEFVITEYEKK